jgi:hypothetical protein
MPFIYSVALLGLLFASTVLAQADSKFERVLWLEGKDSQKGRLYLIIPARIGDPRDLGPYAAAAVKEVQQAPAKDATVVFVLRGTLLVGMSRDYLHRIATASPEKRGAMFAVPAWTRGLVPDNARPLDH